MVKFAYVSMLKTVGHLREDLIWRVLVLTNYLVFFFFLAVFVMADAFPQLTMIALLAGVEPASLRITGLFDPSMAINVAGIVTFVTSVVVWLRVSSLKRKIGLVPTVSASVDGQGANSHHVKVSKCETVCLGKYDFNLQASLLRSGTPEPASRSSHWPPWPWISPAWSS